MADEILTPDQINALSNEELRLVIASRYGAVRGVVTRTEAAVKEARQDALTEARQVESVSQDWGRKAYLLTARIEQGVGALGTVIRELLITAIVYLGIPILLLLMFHVENVSTYSAFVLIEANSFVTQQEQSEALSGALQAVSGGGLADIAQIAGAISFVIILGYFVIAANVYHAVYLDSTEVPRYQASLRLWRDRLGYFFGIGPKVNPTNLDSGRVWVPLLKPHIGVDYRILFWYKVVVAILGAVGRIGSSVLNTKVSQLTGAFFQDQTVIWYSAFIIGPVFSVLLLIAVEGSLAFLLKKSASERAEQVALYGETVYYTPLQIEQMKQAERRVLIQAVTKLQAQSLAKSSSEPLANI